MAYSYKGAISFGLVYIPISLHASIKENDIGFNMLDKKTMSRVKYKKTCVDCNEREVNHNDIVKGYQYEKDKYVVFTDEDLDKLKTEKDKNITIEKFVNITEIDPIYYDRAYYVEPTGGKNAFTLLLKAMEKEGKAGIAKTMLGTKEALVVLRSRNGKMLVNTLYFDDEVKKAPEVDNTEINDKEFKLAKNLIDNMTGKFNPEEFKDEYQERLRKAIERKVEGKEISRIKEKKQGNISNLLDALQASINNESKKKNTKKAKKKNKND
jgi:DNA end-binding protein Ku